MLRQTLDSIPSGQRWLLGVVSAVVVVGAVGYVALSLSRPDPPTFQPSPIAPSPAGERLVGPVRYTVDARDENEWQFFSFAVGSLVVDPRPFDWDLGFRRFQVIVNGGRGFPGLGGVVPVAGTTLADVSSAPEEGYVGTEVARGDSVSAPLRDWYDYSLFTHLLTPGPQLYALRTADGRYAVLRFESYYCPGAQPGCVTFEYVFQGGGGRELTGLSPSGAAPAASEPGGPPPGTDAPAG